MNILICDDSVRDRANIRCLLSKYMDTQKESVRFLEFSDGSDLITYLKDHSADMIFLDIFMNQMNGIETARELRSLGCSACLIFISSSREFAVDSYSVQANYYLVKPVRYEDISSAMVSCMHHPVLEHSFQNYQLTVTHKRQEITIPQMTINYIEVYNRILTVHCTDRLIETYSTLDSVMDKLNRNCFIRPNRSYILNMNYIDHLDGNQFILKNRQAVLISRLQRRELCKTYFAFLTEQLWGPEL